MYENPLTDQARKVIQLAVQEVQRHKHQHIGTEHILLGLIAPEASGVAQVIFTNLGLDLTIIRSEAEKVVNRPAETLSGTLEQTKKVGEYAKEEAQTLGRNHIGTEHLLLGLMREKESLAAEVLMRLGLSLSDVRQQALNVLGQPSETALVPDTAETASLLRDPIVGIQHLPEHAQEIARLFDRQIDLMRHEKEEFVELQKFEPAAYLRHIGEMLKKLRNDFIRQWPNDS